MIRGQQQIVPSFVPRPLCNQDGEDDGGGGDDDVVGDDDELVNEAFNPLFVQTLRQVMMVMMDTMLVMRMFDENLLLLPDNVKTYYRSQTV